MNVLYWAAAVLVLYTYIGYLLVLRANAALRKAPIRQAEIFPSVTILMSVRNEAKNLPTKLRNLKLLNYPADHLQIIVVSDGSTDDTAALLQSEGAPVSAVILNGSVGKAWALNQGAKKATGDILLFVDARQLLDANALPELVKCFSDPTVGAVSGELVLEDETGTQSGLGIYWRIEKATRKFEALTGSVVGVTGAIYAIRRELYTEMPRGTILDDVYIPMQIARKGWRVAFQPSAIARDKIFGDPKKEFSRKVRTLTGNYQLLRLAPWLLTPANPLLFRFISHKLLRLVVPFALVLLFVLSAVLSSPFYHFMFWVQFLFYSLAALGYVAPTAARLRPIAVAKTFVMLNVAAALALYNFISGRDNVWT